MAAAPRTPKTSHHGASACSAVEYFASGSELGHMAPLVHAEAFSFQIRCGDQLFHQHNGAQHPGQDSGSARQPPGILQHVGFTRYACCFPWAWEAA